MKIIKKTKSCFQTKKLGKVLAKDLIKNADSRKTVCLALVGDLGGGKTSFIQGLAEGLGIQKKITSPTFIIFKKFKTENFNFFYHFDCYRIKKPKEILDLGFQEIISSPKNIVAIEWAERIEKILPQNTIFINFEFVDKNTRKIKINWR